MDAHDGKNVSIAKKQSAPRTKTYQDEEDDVEELSSCGFGGWRPQWLQVFSNPMFFLINMSLVGIIESMNGPTYFSTMSTLEKRYSFDSRVSGLILIIDNISQLIISPIFGYLAVRFNRARLIAIGEMVLALSCFISASPYFIYGPSQFSLNPNPSEIRAESFLKNQSTRQNFQQQLTFEVCETIDSESNPARYPCYENDSNTVWPAVCILLFGSLIRGIGITCYFVIGLPFLDDNISKKNSPMYLSIIQSIRLIGPASGYLLSAFCLSFFENPMVDPGLSRQDPRFVGAWWLAFLIVGSLLFVFSIPLFLFPAQFKNASVKSSTLKKKMKNSGGSLKALKRFVTNPLVMFYVGGNIFRFIGLGGYIMLKTKYIESQYRQSSSSASFITGTTSILPMAVGILLGGALLSIFKPKARTLLIFVFIVESVPIFTIGSGIFLGCDSIQIQGHHTNDGLLALDSDCNKQCGCTTHIFTPLCGPDKKTTYFSPCYAGCKSYDAFNKTFQDCSCFSGSVGSGYCVKDSENCENLFYYLMSILSGAIISSLAETATALISFRSVDPIDKSFTMGAAASIFAVFAFTPYPLLFGYIADSVCLVWESKCNQKGNCWFYDQAKFRNYLHGTSGLFMLLASVFNFFMIFFSSRIRNVYDDNDDDDDEKQPPKLSTEDQEMMNGMETDKAQHYPNPNEPNHQVDSHQV